MLVYCNGEERTLSATTSLSQALVSWGYQTGGFAVAINFKVIPQSQHASTTLQAGDAIEIIHAAIGG